MDGRAAAHRIVPSRRLVDRRARGQSCFGQANGPEAAAVAEGEDDAARKDGYVDLPSYNIIDNRIYQLHFNISA